MNYQTAHARLEHHQLAIIGALIPAFVVAFVLMFIHPTASLAVFAIALIGLIVGLAVAAFLRRAERIAARADLAQHVCPRCDAPVEHPAARPMNWRCAACEAEFTEGGTQVG